MVCLLISVILERDQGNKSGKERKKEKENEIIWNAIKIAKP